jgi:hypothetical protein
LDDLVYEYANPSLAEQDWKGKACCTPQAEDIQTAANKLRAEWELKDDGMFLYQGIAFC